VVDDGIDVDTFSYLNTLQRGTCACTGRDAGL